MNCLPFENLNREILIKKESDTDPSLGQDPNNRPVDELIEFGIVNIDKPSGPTSHQVSDYVQRILNIEKAGHSGTLDPGVTGVLAVALGRATRIVQALLPAGKEYICVMHVHETIAEEKVRKVLRDFTGTINQMPPIKSAVKREERERNIYYSDVLEIDGKDVLFRIGCQAGTYIRKYCHDAGQSLGTGAHMAELRRTKAGCFDESTLVSLQNLADAYYYWKEDGKDTLIRKAIQPIESAVAHFPKIWVHDSAVESLCHGRDIGIPGISKLHSGISERDNVALFTLKSELIGLAEMRMSSEDIIQNAKGIAAKTHKVFMKETLYKMINKDA